MLIYKTQFICHKIDYRYIQNFISISTKKNEEANKNEYNKMKPVFNNLHLEF
jgi:hypothetical protein